MKLESGDQKGIEFSLKNNEERYRSIVENINDGLIIHDFNGIVKSVNKNMCDLLHYSQEELIGMHLTDLHSPKMKPCIAKIVENKSWPKKILTEQEMMNKDGEVLSVELSGSIVSSEEDGLVQVFVRDITEKKRTEEKYRKYISYAPHGLIVTDSVGNIMEVNAATSTISGYSSEELIKMNITDLTHEDEGPRAFNVFKTINSTGYIKSNIQIVTKDKRKRTLSVSAVKLSDNTILSFGEDITEAKAQVEKLLKEKDQLLLEVHHRIKNHMNTIYSIISLRSSYINDTKLLSILEEVKNKIRLMQGIYQTLYTGESLEEIRISSYLEKLLYDIQSAYVEENKVQIKTNIEDITVSSKQSFPIGIIIAELISNSLKYAFDKGNEGRVDVSILKSEDNVLSIEVADNGRGIPQEIIKNKNYGFGLILVQGYVEQFAGELLIENTQGTKVSILLELE